MNSWMWPHLMGFLCAEGEDGGGESTSVAGQLLQKEQVREVWDDFVAIQASGVAVLESAADRRALRSAIAPMLDAIQTLTEEHVMLLQVSEPDPESAAAYTITNEHREMVAEVRETIVLQSREETDGDRELFPYIASALFLVRRRLRQQQREERSARQGAEPTEEETIDMLDGALSIIIPNVSLRQLWERNRGGFACLWNALGSLIETMDSVCPDAEAPPPAGSSPNGTP